MNDVDTDDFGFDCIRNIFPIKYLKNSLIFFFNTK